MKVLRPFFTIFLLSFLFGQLVLAQPTNSAALPRSKPEAEGVSSEAIQSFLNAVEKSKHEFHSFMILRHGKVVAESWWSPYRPDLRHTLYSCSKSFTATAVGFAVSEGKLALTDKVVSFFPDYQIENLSPNLATLTIRDLLTMTVGQAPDPSFSIAASKDDWIQGFFNTPIVDQPGTKFLYNSLATYMAGVIVQRVSKQSLIDYLKPRLFEPLGIEDADWEEDLQGYSVGGWGLRVKTEDMAKFAQLFLQKGKWNGLQVLPAEWVEEATTLKILQNPNMKPEDRAKSDWDQGYCYQMWRSRHNSYRGDGAYGQYMLVLPEQDAVIAITEETDNLQGVLDLVWTHLLPGFQKKAMPESPGYAVLENRMSKLSLPMAKGEAKQPAKEALPAKKHYEFPINDTGIQSVYLTFQEKEFRMILKNNEGVFPLFFGEKSWKFGATPKLGPYLVSGIKGSMEGLPPSQVAGSYAWLDDKTMQLKLRYIESPHSETYTLHFEGGKLTLDFEKSTDFGSKKMTIVGQ
ncbi:MAG: beta-lactamase family protein [Saprospiraceae bacterium]|nr:beta-lactamase family protein [Saprospiraceae bacterium]